MAAAFEAHAFQSANLYAAAFEADAEERVSTDSGTGNSSSGIVGVGGTNEAAGQSFTTGVAFTATGFMWRLLKASAPTDNLLFELVDNNITSGTVLASATVAATPLTTTGIYYGFFFDASVALAASTQYFIRVTRSGARDATNFARVGTWTTGTASGGSYWGEASGVWTANATFDMQMAVFGDPIAVNELPILVMAPR